jgi:PST family polysaccharide transporter
MALASWIRFAIQFAATIAIARILGPTEYGAAAVIVVFGGAAELLRDSGFSTLVLQRVRLRRELVSAVHYVSCSIGLALGTCLAFSGPLLATAFNNKSYELFALFLSLIFLFASMGAIPNALLARNFEFRRIASIEIVAVIISSGVGLALALSDRGALALVLQSVTYMMTQSIFTMLVCPWRPGRPASLRIVRRTLPFIWNVSFAQGLNYFSRNIDNVLVGFFFGPRAAGLYNQAYQLMVIPLQQINGPLQRVFVPVLSRIYVEPARYRRFFRIIVLIVALILWPGFIGLAIFSDSLVVSLFGPDWIESARIFGALSLAGMAQALGYVNSWLFVSSGQVRRQTYWTIATRPLIVGSFFVGIPWGPYGMALAYAVASTIVIFPGFLVARRRANLTLGDLFRPVFWPCVLALVTVGSALALKIAIPPGSNLILVLVDLAILAFILVCLILVIKPLRIQLLPMLAYIRSS